MKALIDKNTVDPRKGLPSASDFQRYALCPGSWRLESELRTKEPGKPKGLPSDRYAEKGTLIHEAIAEAKTENEINGAIEDIAAECLQLEAETLHETLGGPPQVLLREQRLWMTDPDSEELAPLFSGRFDLFARRGDTCAIIDFKTGWTEIEAEDNWQLRALIALAAVNNLIAPDQSVYAGIIAPYCSPQVRLTLFDPAAVSDAIVRSRDLARQIQHGWPARIPSFEACRYCPARAICPEARTVLAQFALTTIKAPDREVINGATMAWLLDRCAIAERLSDAIKAEAKLILERDPNGIPGWHLKPGVKREKINDVGKIWMRLGTVGIAVSPAVFASHCDMTKTSLTSLARAASGLRGKKLETLLAEVVEGATEKTVTAPSLRRLTKRAAEATPEPIELEAEAPTQLPEEAEK